MAGQEPSDLAEANHSYLDVGPSGPSAWVLALGGLLLLAAILAVFYGLYTLNKSASLATIAPTASPIAPVSTQAAGPETPVTGQAIPPSSVPLVTMTHTPGATVAVTAQPPTYTVKQGDTLIEIAHALNVNADELATLNQTGGETIRPGQVLRVPATVTPWPENGPFPHTVGTGETLLSIAQLYRVEVEEIKALNGLTSDTIFVSQQILIPADGVRPLTPTPTPQSWQPAPITDDLDSIYSLTTARDQFDLHVRPNTRETAKVARLVEDALGYSQTALQRTLPGRLEVYVSDTLFETPYTHRRSFSRADEGQLFVLYDGTGTPVERLYFITHALTPLVAAQTLGDAASPLLEEGLAVYVAGQALSSVDDRYPSTIQFCVAYQQARKLPRVTQALTLEGQLGHLDQHLAAGCFVRFLIDNKGWGPFAQLYPDGDYRAVYGRTLNQLAAEWTTWLRAAAGDLPFDPQAWVDVAAEVDDAYRRLWAGFEGTASQFAAYQQLDRAQMALLQGLPDDVEEHLASFDALLGDE